MSHTAYGLSAEAQNFNWLLGKFAAETAGVLEAIAVSSDGLLMAMSAGQQRAARTGWPRSPPASPAWPAAPPARTQLGTLNKVIVDMADGYLLVTAISSGSVLGVIAAKTANLGNIAYEMTLFANRAGAALTPQLINELKNSLGD